MPVFYDLCLCGMYARIWLNTVWDCRLHVTQYTVFLYTFKMEGSGLAMQDQDNTCMWFFLVFGPIGHVFGT